MIELIGGAVMMAGGGMLTASSVAMARTLSRSPVGAIGVALDEVYPADAEPVPDDLAKLIGLMP